MKKCSKCNKVYDDTWKICLSDQSVLIEIADTDTSTTHHYVAEKKDEVKGVGGWLGLYVWGMLVVMPILTILVVVSFIATILEPGQSNSPPWHEALILIVLGVLMVMACYRLLKNKKGAVAFVKKVLLFVISAHVWFLALEVYRASQGQYDGGADGIVRGLGFNVAWYLYFIKSKRVHNTYTN